MEQVESATNRLEASLRPAKLGSACFIAGYDGSNKNRVSGFHNMTAAQPAKIRSCDQQQTRTHSPSYTAETCPRLDRSRGVGRRFPSSTTSAATRSYCCRACSTCRPGRSRAVSRSVSKFSAGSACARRIVGAACRHSHRECGPFSRRTFLWTRPSWTWPAD
jgi:hypothetical protein